MTRVDGTVVDVDVTHRSWKIRVRYEIMSFMYAMIRNVYLIRSAFIQ